MCMGVIHATHWVMVNTGHTGDEQVSAVKHQP